MTIDYISHYVKMMPVRGVGGFGGGATGLGFVSGGVTPILWGGDRGINARGRSGGTDDIYYWSISSGANGSAFGELDHTNQYNSSVSNISRAVIARGGTGDSTYADLDYITVANTGNATHFGNLSNARYGCGASSDGTSGLFWAGTVGSGAGSNRIDKITIATTGNATDWADEFGDIYGCAACGDGTRSLNAGGYRLDSPAGYQQRISYTIYTNNINSSDFGDLTYGGVYWLAACSDMTVALFAGGQPGSGGLPNNINTVTIQTIGNATEFGDLAWANKEFAGAGDSTNGCFVGGRNSANNASTDAITYVTYATPGNSVDTCDLGVTTQYNTACSGD